MSQSSFYSELANALRERRATIADHAFRDRDSAAHLAKLITDSEKIVALQALLPADADGQLRHYLERCSYDKALAFVEALSGQPPSA